MGPGAAQVESLDRAAVVRMAEERPRRPELVESEGAVEDVAADEAEVALQVGGREGAVAEDARAESWGVRFDDIEDPIDSLALAHIPVRLGREVLAEETRDVLAFRREPIVE